MPIYYNLNQFLKLLSNSIPVPNDEVSFHKLWAMDVNSNYDTFVGLKGVTTAVHLDLMPQWALEAPSPF